ASATMPTWVTRMIDRHLREPAWVRVAASEDNLQLEHGLARVDRASKLPTLVRLLRQFEGSAIVFSRTKHGVGKLHGELRRHGLVINYELPDTPQWLTHRVGRTARMGGRGWALTFLTPEDRYAWNRLRRQGAPALSDVDLSHLLDVGEWRYSEDDGPADPTNAHQRPPQPRPHGRPSGGRRRRRGGRGRGGPAPRLTND
ncbi:MAG TPA: DEAD/DEAH box helicase, partial [Candidatus Binatia bacterium]|nr:DEAD/DEAH box helicase [Candidatus Binatia bacterium]